MITFTHINLLCIPLNAYYAGVSQTQSGVLINVVALVINLVVVAVKLS